MRNDSHRVLRQLTAVPLLAALAACGGSGPTGSTTPTTLPPPTPPPPVVISQGNGFPLAKLNLGFLSFTTTSVGTVEAIVDWTFATNDIDVYLARGACSFEQFVTEQCTFLAFSESTTAKPERPRATNVPAGTHTMWVGNLGPGDESVSYQIVFSANATAGTPPAAASQAESIRPRFDKGRPAGSVPLR